MLPISLYRKWRPQRFDEVVNQAPVVKTLAGAIRHGHISHAYLFAGPRGTGKTTIARLLAKAVNCENNKSFEPCNRCQSCLEISESRSLDIFEIDAASHRGIDKIRDLIEKIKFTPARARYKVFVIDEVHMLTREAFNALLKTLEEPPVHAIFILATTEAYKIPPTILSRCQRFDFKRLSVLQISQQLEKIAKTEKIKIEAGGTELLAQNSEGSLRDAIGFLDQLRAMTKSNITLADIEYVLGLTSQKSVLRLMDLIFKNSLKEAVELVNKIFSKGYELPQFANAVIEELRKLVLAKSGLEFSFLGLDEDEEAKFSKWQDRVSLKRLLEIIKAFRGVEDYLKTVSQPPLALEMVLVELIVPNLEKDGETRFQDKIVKPSVDSPKSDTSKSSSSKSNLKIEHPKQNLKTENPQEMTKFIELWAEICEKVKEENSSLASFLKMCVPLQILDDKIIIGAKFKLYIDKIHEKKVLVEKVIEAVFGQGYELSCEKVTDQNKDQFQQNSDKLREAEEQLEEKLAQEARQVFE